MVELVWLVAGGFLGAAARYVVTVSVARCQPTKFPLGALLVNVIGSFLLGWLVGGGVDASLGLMWGTGFMGAFTTFWTFKLESLTLFRQGLGKVSFGYTGLSYVLGLAAAWFGLWLGIML